MERWTDGTYLAPAEKNIALRSHSALHQVGTVCMLDGGMNHVSSVDYSCVCLRLNFMILDLLRGLFAFVWYFPKEKNLFFFSFKTFRSDSNPFWLSSFKCNVLVCLKLLRLNTVKTIVKPESFFSFW